MIKIGENIFYTDNQSVTGSFHVIAVKVIRSLGLVPFYYMGAGLDVRGSSLEKEISQDFSKSRVIVIVLGKGEGWRSIQDVWAITELPSAVAAGKECLIYHTSEVSAVEIESLKLPAKPTEVRD
jgi:hypothetical protein